ncbi:murein hydrolase activator EnvC family protein [Zavarzinia compransoris]|uniref:M23ase beta-sheet core domain-containing protein n=1 Tax=Zavarzinia compransoris TaxID=1264899 RepID=A0A317E9B5_9PROT|nr:peptidoglycan DD-metalloendopeptidase family protein [Zavarzinia compransoris]PWR21705.1 hypothetical protein DKG75_06820 [Zavarzinia compransoris]TDP45509.1 septal ring factor EnvC (AmiA/AmiB activator) [Zavarzinia compransoris]
MLTGALVLGLALPAAGQQADPENLRAVQAELDAARRRQAEAAGEQARLAAEIERLRDQLVQRAAVLRQREGEADALERRLAELGASEAEKLAALADRRAALSRLLGALTRLSRRPPVLLMARRQNALEIAHTGTVLRDLVPELRSRAHALSRELNGLTALRARLAADRAALDATLAALALERGEIDRLLAKKAEDGKRLATLVQAESKRVDELAAKAKSIEDLIAAVEKARREREAAEAAANARRAAELAAAETAARRPGQEAVAAEAPATPAAAPRPAVMARFASLKGKLPWPAAGEITTRFGDRQANGLTAKGFRIATRAGARVTAPAAGDVAFAAPFSGYGQLLILSQGDGYHLLLAGMERIDVTVGQKVLAGEPVGQMEGAEQGTRPVLYVELRHNGEPVDLTPWLGPGATKVSG